MKKKHNGTVYLMELIVFPKKKVWHAVHLMCLTYLVPLIQLKAL